MSGIFECIFCGTVTTRNYVADEGMAKRLGAMQTAVVAEGHGGRVYLPPESSPLPANIPNSDTRGLEREFAPNVGQFRLWVRSGKSREARVAHAGERTQDEAEYLTLIWALTDLNRKITDAGRDPGDFTLTVFSRRELVVKQLTGVYKVRSRSLQSHYAEAIDLLGRFKSVNVVWKQGTGIVKLFR
jgi:hypothetical protein